MMHVLRWPSVGMRSSLCLIRRLALWSYSSGYAVSIVTSCHACHPLTHATQPRDPSVLQLLHPYVFGGRLVLQSGQAVTLHALMQTMIAKLMDAARAVEQKRVAQV
jgi:hypothetical protein